MKLKLPDPESHQKVIFIFSPFHLKTHCQYNTFFDSAGSELSSCRAILQLRFYNDDLKCVVSLKAKATIVNDVSRVEEDEEEMDPLIGRECVNDPMRLRSIDSRVVKRARDEFRIGELGLICVFG